MSTPVFEFKMTGMPEIFATLDRLVPELQQKLERQAMKAAMQPIFAAYQRALDAIPATHSEWTGEYKAGVRNVSTKMVSGKYVYAQVTNVWPLAYCVEKGHRVIRGGKNRIMKNGTTKGSGKVVGWAQPRHDMWTALQQNSEIALNILESMTGQLLSETVNVKGGVLL